MDFQVLGPVCLHVDGSTIEFGEPRRQAVLAALLLEAGRTVAVDTLVDRVWGESPPRHARRTLQAHITRIRRVLERAHPDGEQPDGAQLEGVRVVRDSGGYRLSVRPEQVDVFRFRSAFRDHPADVTAMRTALGLRHGEPLAGLRGAWAERIRSGLRQEYAAAVVAWAGAEIRSGNAASTIVRLTELTDEHPLQEMAAATLMRALYAVGRGAEALAHYERIRRALREELGAYPGPELTAVHEAVLRHDLEPYGGPSAAGPGQASAPVPAQLPADVGAFTGRSDELAELDRLAAKADGESTVICVVGTAGAGKTATAVHWGHRAREGFPDGQLYLDLCGYGPDKPMSSTDALAVLLTALLPEGREIPLRQAERAARFRTEMANRRMLVLLDNVATVEQVRPLLPGTPGCVVVVTSRDSLAGLVALHGAHRIEVDRLPAADAVALLRRLIGERVDAAMEVGQALAERCVRLPLALRLAAEHAAARPAVPLSRLVDELSAAQRTLDLLSGGSDQRAAVRAVFSWSLRHVDPNARRTFAALGRYPARQFGVRALAAFTGSPPQESGRLLDILVRANLVHSPGADRYDVHDLLKAYAAEVDSDLDESGALDRLYGYYLATVAAAMDRLYPGEAHRRPAVDALSSPAPSNPAPSNPAPSNPAPSVPDGRAARDWLDSELPTIGALVAHAATSGLPQYAVTLSALLFRYLDGLHEAAALAIHGHARAAARALGDRTAEGSALIALGGVHGQAGRSELAAAEMWAAYDLFEESGNVLGRARALGNVGMLEESVGRYPTAAGYYTRAQRMFHQVGDVTGRAHMLTRLGTVEVRLGSSRAGHDHLRQAMLLHRQAGHLFGEAWVKIGLGELAARDGKPAEAVQAYTEAAELFGRLGHRDSEAWAFDGLGRTEVLDGRPFDAVGHHQDALDLFREHHDRVGEAWALNGLGEACQAGGDLTTARDHHVEALTVALRIGGREQVARARRGLARAAAGYEPDNAGPHHNANHLGDAAQHDDPGPSDAHP